MDAKILTQQFYPVMKNIYKHLDLKSFITLFNVSKQMRENVTNHFNTFNEYDWLDFFQIKFTKTKDKTGYHLELINVFALEDLRTLLRKQQTFINSFKEQLIKIDYILEIIDYRTLSEEFVRKNIEYVEMDKISGLVKLSEEFIREYKERLDWDMICKYQSLSIEFVKEHRHYVNWAILIKYNRIPTKHFYSLMLQFKNEIEQSMEMWEYDKNNRAFYGEYNFTDDFYWELKDE